MREHIDYDYCIIGGGISGLYLGYRLLQRDIGCKLIILEKEGILGGRIMNGKIEGNNGDIIPVSAGAGRFSKDHYYFMKLIREFKLTESIHELSRTSAVYNIRDSSISSSYHLHQLLGLVKKGSQSLCKKELISYSFIELARRFISESDIQYILGSFGYYSELVIMNAFNALKLLDDLNKRFYVLSGSFMQIIDLLKLKILELGGKISLRSNVYNVLANNNTNDRYQITWENGKGNIVDVIAKNCIFAVPVPIMNQFRILSPLRSVLKNIICAPLCRIYATYVPYKESVWFAGLSRFTVNNNLRMVIPISESAGVIMISYSDHHFANGWKKIYDQGGKRGLKKEIRRLITEAMGRPIPDCKSIEIYYWECGVGYWGRNADSDSINRDLIQPNKNKGIYLCGENIATNNQQWIEGGLETAEQVLNVIL